MQEPPTKAKGSAPGQYLGYALQPVRLCYHLLNSDQTASASIEHMDDVAVKWDNGSVLLEQTKSALKTNPVSDWSNDLWKTFANWIDNIDSGLIDPDNTTFQLYVTPSHTGHWVQRLNDTNFPSDTARLVLDLAGQVDSLPRRPRCHRYIMRFLSTKSTILAAIITNFRLRTDDDPIEAIREKFRLSVPETLLDTCSAFAIGNAKEAADKLIRSDTPGVIRAAEFQRTVRAYVSKNNLLRYLPSFATTPSTEMIDKTITDQPTFVQQLDLVQMPHNQIVRAISDLLLSASDKTDWADKGLVVEESLTAFNQGLMRTHGLQKLEIDDIHSSLPPDAQGRLLYKRCVSTEAHVDGREVPTHFVPGCFNELADRMQLGWHPDFSTLLDS